jgi:hypothetical protein
MMDPKYDDNLKGRLAPDASAHLLDEDQKRQTALKRSRQIPLFFMLTLWIVGLALSLGISLAVLYGLIRLVRAIWRAI